MKNRSVFLFCLLQAFYPLCLLIGSLTGRKFVLFSEIVYLVAVTAASVWASVQAKKGPQTQWAIGALVLSLIHGLTILLSLFWWGGGFAAVVLILCGWVVFDRTPRGFFRGLTQVLTLLLTFLLILMTPFWFFAAAMGSHKVVKTLASPDRCRTAIVTSHDQGALGGDTVVEVRDNRRSIPILVGTFTDSVRLWQGGWGDHESMTLLWEDEKTLQINGISYHVTGEDAALIADISHILEAEISQGQVLEASDTHGGFHGDGDTFVKIRGTCTVPDSPHWQPLPAVGQAEQALSQSPIPEVEKGWYYVWDRHYQSTDPASGAALLAHGSRNYTLAVYDEPNRILYYYKLDT